VSRLVTCVRASSSLSAKSVVLSKRIPFSEPRDEGCSSRPPTLTDKDFPVHVDPDGSHRDGLQNHLRRVHASTPQRIRGARQSSPAIRSKGSQQTHQFGLLCDDSAQSFRKLLSIIGLDEMGKLDEACEVIQVC